MSNFHATLGMRGFEFEAFHIFDVVNMVWTYRGSHERLVVINKVFHNVWNIRQANFQNNPNNLCEKKIINKLNHEYEVVEVGGGVSLTKPAQYFN